MSELFIYAISLIVILWLWNRVYSGDGITSYYDEQLGHRVINNQYTVKEVLEIKEQFPSSDIPRKSDLPEAQKKLLTPSGELEEGLRVFDNDPNETVLTLNLGASKKQLLFKGNTVYQVQGSKLSEQLHSFTEANIDSIRYVNYLDKDTMLMVARATNKRETDLWQVDLNSYAMLHLSDESYYEFERPPLVFTPDGFDGVIAIYYSETERFGFINHFSTPKYSTLRIYSPKYPKGEDIVRYSHQAGTIIDVTFDGQALLITSDPNKPFHYDKPLRDWKLFIRD